MRRCISPPSCKDSGDAKEPTEFFHERGFEPTFSRHTDEELAAIYAETTAGTGRT
jgi:hypothetical protein